ncbi:response regulator receiver domain-containing protein [Oceanotoga teriensis]|jgi:CheY-like chemotaxis protein|uniref:Response regulator receiver domain-containing protein n=1 Tax=Oceanotoga teriensis TaxID=515440 RepID=A0AA45C758_9BACT|nr:response regulator receiver domain-containing protein [Oceanotoga teriensis]
MLNSKKPILLVEDDRIDAMSVKRSLQELKIVNDLIIRNNGEEALKYLLDSENEIPCIILLDLNMPKMNGIDFLRERIKYDNLKLIPTIVLTTSREEQDRVNSFSLGVSGFMIKPVDYKQFVDVIKTIDLYWSLSELP